MASVPFVSSSPQDDGSPPQADCSSSVLRPPDPRNRFAAPLSANVCPSWTHKIANSVVKFWMDRRTRS